MKKSILGGLAAGAVALGITGAATASPAHAAMSQDRVGGVLVRTGLHPRDVT